MFRSLKFRLPCSLTIRAPLCSLACHTQNTAPSGSANTAIRPAFITSKGSVRTWPPASRTLDAVSSALSTQTYVFHLAMGGPPSGIPPTAATSPPRIRALKYLASDPGGITSSNSHPNRPL